MPQASEGEGHDRALHRTAQARSRPGRVSATDIGTTTSTMVTLSVLPKTAAGRRRARRVRRTTVSAPSPAIRRAMVTPPRREVGGQALDAVSDTGVAEAWKVGPDVVRSRRFGPVAPRGSSLGTRRLGGARWG
ncbi:hypothetical protein [Streptomyces phaeochromogenes]|uniref:hypothetical protein n=1 Tax=Streptomyces phaeochromogenes TaxID=1923 RepID=UPI0039A2A076